jgi:hypothetical protein
MTSELVERVASRITSGDRRTLRPFTTSSQGGGRIATDRSMSFSQISLSPPETAAWTARWMSESAGSRSGHGAHRDPTLGNR